MKRIYFLALSLFLGGVLSQAQTYQNNIPATAVDGTQRGGACGFGTQPGVNMSDITVPLTGTIIDASKITVNLSLGAAWLGDVVVELVSPGGEAITLIRRVGAGTNSSCGDSSSFITANILGFNSANVNPIDAGAVGTTIPVPAGNYTPTYGTAKFPIHNPASMATFLNGKQLGGAWRLIVYDYGVGDATTLNSWQIVVAAGATLRANETGTFGSEISIKQNPVQDNLLIDVTNDFKSLNLEIYDASGKRIKSENVLRSVNEVAIDVRNLTPGMYLLNPVKDGERKQSIKFIKK